MKRVVHRSGQRGRRLAVLCLAAGLGLAIAAPGAPAARAVGPPASGRSAVLAGIQWWTGPEGTRLVLETSRPVAFTTAADSAGRNFRVMLAGAVPSPSVAAVREVNDGAVRAIRVTETPQGVNVVIEVVEMPSAAPFPVEEGGGESPRLILDVPRPGRAAREEVQAKVARELARAQARVVVIDPGHGGEHSGAIGPQRTVEKHICLAIARRLADRLNREAGVRAFLTRTGDYNVALRDRYRYAERLEADAFISVHANSGRRRTGRGTEVYFLSLDSASDEQAKLLADVENAADVGGGVPASGGDIVSILFDLKQQAVLRQSSMLAEAVLEEITGDRRLANRGVKQAPFAVLKSPAVPSILVETAFINHPQEARLLRRPESQERLADQIARGVLRYLATAPVAAGGGSGNPGRP